MAQVVRKLRLRSEGFALANARLCAVLETMSVAAILDLARDPATGGLLTAFDEEIALNEELLVPETKWLSDDGEIVTYAMQPIPAFMQLAQFLVARGFAKAGEPVDGWTILEPVLPPQALDVGDAGFDPEIGRRVEVLLDGEVRDHIISYDCRAGTIERYVCKADGQVCIENDEAAKETLTGDVTVRWRADAEA